MKMKRKTSKGEEFGGELVEKHPSSSFHHELGMLVTHGVEEPPKEESSEYVGVALDVTAKHAAAVGKSSGGVEENGVDSGGRSTLKGERRQDPSSSADILFHTYRSAGAFTDHSPKWHSRPPAAGAWRVYATSAAVYALECADQREAAPPSSV